MLIDSHCHLDASDFRDDFSAVLQRARAAQVGAIVVPAVGPQNFDAVRDIAWAEPDVCYALGIHPLYIDGLGADALDVLRAAVAEARDDPKLVAIGEIGLDFFVPGFNARDQEFYYQAQLQIARDFDLPVILHVRRSQDRLLKYLRSTPVSGGIAHAFNGSVQQAEAFLALGFALGFGGAMTFERALQIRRLATGLVDTAHVLETDAPDIAPEWIRGQRNEPGELGRIAEVFAELRGEEVGAVVRRTGLNVGRVLPKVGGLFPGVQLSCS